METLFLAADAKVMNGEEHAAVQMLKTAQRRFPRHGDLHIKIQKLEQLVRLKDSKIATLQAKLQQVGI